jgi:hypothetical protein
MLTINQALVINDVDTLKQELQFRLNLLIYRDLDVSYRKEREQEIKLIQERINRLQKGLIVDC